ncbi:MAG: mechanosensitive ion channel family protein [Dehalococcoidales bacterium]|nr:mechanosensitive ion channel family protein [Dehalococcoidales bacterium]
MNKLLISIIQNWQEIVIPLAIFVATLVIGYALGRLLVLWLSLRAKKSKIFLNANIIAAARLPYAICVLIIAIYLGLRFSKLPENVAVVSNKILTILVILFVTMFLANVVSRLIRAYSTRAEANIPASSITENIIRSIIFIIGILVILSTLGIEITPMLATLGVAGLAVALALQPTLSNLFAGIQVVSDRILRRGDYIELDNGAKGYVADIGWRSTRLRTPYNTLVIIPNSRLGESTITNYGSNKKLGFIVYAGVSYSSDLQHVEQVALAAAQEVINKFEEADKSFEPWFDYDEFGESNIIFWLWLQAKDRIASFKVKSELIKCLHARFAKEGITINYPVRTTYLQWAPGAQPGHSPINKSDISSRKA